MPEPRRAAVIARDHSGGPMSTVESYGLPEFLRAYEHKGHRLAWFLGAGASAAAGIPTAGDLVWEFKRTIYCSREGVHRSALPNLADPATRQLLQGYFDGLGTFPALGDDDEYSFYFEFAHRVETQRRALIDRYIRGATPSYGHRVLAALAASGHLRLLWTTNFDPCFEDAHALITGSTGGLTTAAPETSDVAIEAFREERWPLQIKLHGDFRSSRLKNTAEELRDQDVRLRQLLTESATRFGLVIVGYSGRDASVMDALADAAAREDGFPEGLYWFIREGSAPSPRVKQLLAVADARGIEARLIEIPNFDEVAADLLVLGPELPEEVARRLVSPRERRLQVPSPIGGRRGSFPALRMNTLPVLESPSMCRLVECDIGGQAEVRDAVNAAGNRIIAARRRAGVLCFGPDVDVRATFNDYGIRTFSMYSIEPHRLAYESMELSLLYEAVVRALSRARLLERPEPRRRTLIVANADAPEFKRLKGAVGGVLVGIIPDTSLRWAEGVRISLDYRLGRLWLCLQPVVWAEFVQDDPELLEARAAFLHERRATRYNKVANRMLDAWTGLVADGAETELRAFDTDDGMNAIFKIHPTNAYSYKASA